MKKLKSFFRSLRKFWSFRSKKKVKPVIKGKENDEKEQYERQLTIQILFKDYTGKNLVSKEIVDTAYEKMLAGKLDKYLSKKFPDREIKTNVTRTRYQVSGVVCIRWLDNSWPQAVFGSCPQSKEGYFQNKNSVIYRNWKVIINYGI